MLGEPTNDLDTDTLAAVEDLLDGWPGTLVVVSHDRYLLERVTDHQIALLGDGKIRALPGGVEQYLRIREGREPAPAVDGRTYRGQSSTAAAQASAAQGPAAGGPAVQTPAARPPQGTASAPGPGSAGSGSGSGTGSGTGSASPSEAEKRQARKTMQRVEKQMEKLSARQAELHEQMAGASEAMEIQRLRELQEELAGVDTELAEAEEAWLEASETAEG